jgi:hypothetical protein
MLATRPPIERDSFIPAKLHGEDDVYLFVYWSSRELQGTTSRYFSEKTFRAELSAQGLPETQIDLLVANAKPI